MTTDALFRAAATAWFVTGLARVVVVGLNLGPSATDPGGAAILAAGGAAIGVIVGVILWLRPRRSSAVLASVLGVYAVIGLAYLPIVGPQAWFLLLSLTGVVAFVLSAACLVRTWRQPPTPPA